MTHDVRLLAGGGDRIGQHSSGRLRGARIDVGRRVAAGFSGLGFGRVSKTGYSRNEVHSHLQKWRSVENEILV